MKLANLLATLVVLLSACGGGGGAASAADQSSQSVQSAPVLVVAFGDSTQAGVSTATPEVVIPADIAQQVIRQQTGRQDISVRSAGVPGTNAQDLVDGTDGSGLPWAERLRQSGAHIVTVNHAINSARPVRGETDAQYRANLTLLVTTAQAQGKRVVLETPNPMVAGTPVTVGFDLPGLDRKAQIMREVAAATGATLCDEKASIEQQGLVSLRWLPDGVHPHPALYQIKGRLLAECLRRVL